MCSCPLFAVCVAVSVKILGVLTYVFSSHSLLCFISSYKAGAPPYSTQKRGGMENHIPEDRYA